MEVLDTNTVGLSKTVFDVGRHLLVALEREGPGVL